MMLDHLVHACAERGTHAGPDSRRGSTSTRPPSLYERRGFQQIPPFGPYRDDPVSRCYELASRAVRAPRSGREDGACSPYASPPVSMNGWLGAPARVLDEIARWCERAAAEQADLVLFQARDSRPLHAQHAGAGRAGAGRPERAATDRPRPPASLRRLRGPQRRGSGTSSYNTQVLVGPDGYIGRQRKLHLSRDEGMYYTRAERSRSSTSGKCKIGIAICYDNEFPELPRILALRGAEVLLMPHASRDTQWEDTPESEAAARRFMRDYHHALQDARQGERLLRRPGPIRRERAG